MGEHFKIHGAVHAFWLFSLMAAVIAALLLVVPEGQVINNYISFASSIASLILAVVAIFYSMLSNQSFAESVGSLNNSVKEVATVAQNVGRVSEKLSISSETLLGEISTFRPTFEEISIKLEAHASASVPVDQGEGKDFVLQAPSMAGLISFYIIAKAQVTGKITISLDKIFLNNPTWNGHCSGCIDLVRMTKIRDMQISKKRVTESVEGVEESRWHLAFDDFGKFKSDEILKMVAGDTTEDIAKYREIVDGYFREI